MEAEFAILTPEETILELPCATIGTRVVAHLLDLVILSLIFIAWYFVSTLAIFSSGGLFYAITIPVSIIIPFAYFIFFEGLWRGRTPGKILNHLQVTMADGTPVTFQAAIGRNLLRIADMMPTMYFLGLASMFVTTKSQRLGDLVASTIVIKTNVSATIIQQIAPHHAGIHQFEDKIGDLRGMTLEEYEVLKRLCDRYPELPPSKVEKMIDDIWGPFVAKRNLPENPNVHPLLLAEAVVMKFGREHGLI